MKSIVGVMKKVAEHEVSKIYTNELGIVTAVFPHAAENDKDNYQCSVKLKNKKQPDGKDFELRKVPVTTPHIGLANIPNVGDLVLVTFIAGDINAPVIIGRLYNDEDIPPVNKEKEFILQHNLEGGGIFKIDEDGVVTVTSKNEKNIVTVDDNEINIQTEKSNIKVEQSDITIKNENCNIGLSGSNITIKNDTCKITVEAGGITIDAASKNVTVKSMGTIKIGDTGTGSIELG